MAKKLNDEEIVQYARDVVKFNLDKRGYIEDAVLVAMYDEVLLEHIKGLIGLLVKAKEILEGEKK